MGSYAPLLTEAKFGMSYADPCQILVCKTRKKDKNSILSHAIQHFIIAINEIIVF